MSTAPLNYESDNDADNSSEYGLENREAETGDNLSNNDEPGDLCLDLPQPDDVDDDED